MKRTLLFITASLILFGPITLQAQTGNRCDSEEAHQFDFWIGEWDVYKNGTDTLLGHNIIKPVAKACALLESWNSIDNQTIGSSINKYNFEKGKWQQMWVDNSGLTLLIEGEYRDGKMVLENAQPARDRIKSMNNRITWFNNKDGSVRQLWEYSIDEGKTWQVAFDGMYKKVEH